MKRRLIKILNFFLFPIVSLYWRIFQPKSTGIKVFIKYKDKVLFIKNSYGHKYRNWTLPGGGVKKGESLEEAAKREVMEEVGIRLDNLVNKGSFLYTGEGKKNTIWVFFTEVDRDETKIDNFEVEQVSWEKIDSLTLRSSPIARKCFELAGFQE